MISFPYTSIKTVVDNVPSFDRAIDSATKREFNKLRYRRGIAPDAGGAWETTPGTGLSVNVSCNGAWAHVGGSFAYEPAANRILTLSAAESLDRIDRIVLRNNLAQNTRAIDLAILKGTAKSNPTAPALTNNTSVQEIAIADVYVAGNATDITSQNITDLRFNDSLCGMLGGAFGDVNTQQFFNQIQAIIDDLKAEIAGIEQGSEVMLKAVYDPECEGIVSNAKNAEISASCTGNAASATVAQTCTGNAATATTARACTGNAATATTATTATTAQTCTGNAATASVAARVQVGRLYSAPLIGTSYSEFYTGDAATNNADLYTIAAWNGASMLPYQFDYSHTNYIRAYPIGHSVLAKTLDYIKISR